MRTLTLGFVLLVVAVAIGGFWFYQHQAGRTPGIPIQAQRVALELKRGGGTVTFAGSTVPLTNGLEVGLGAVIMTKPDSIVLVRVDQDSWLTIDGDSTVTLTAIGPAKSFSLALGRVAVRIGHLLGSNESFELRTPNSVAAVRGTRFGVSFRSGRTQVIVLERRVEVTPLDPKTGAVIVISAVPALTLKAEQQLVVANAAILAGQPLKAQPVSAADLTNWQTLFEQKPSLEPDNGPSVSDDSNGTGLTPLPATSAEATPVTQKLEAQVAHQVRSLPAIDVNFVQAGPLVLQPGQQLLLQLQELAANGKTALLDSSLFEWSIDGDPGIGEIGAQGLFRAGPYGGSGIITAVKTDQERVIFKRTIRIEVRGTKAPPGFQPG